LRTIIGEMTSVEDDLRDGLALAFATAVLILGYRAVEAVI